MIGMQKDLLTAREVAQRLGISVRTIWRWTALGQIPAPVRPGGPTGRVVRWKTQDIERYVNSLPARRF